MYPSGLSPSPTWVNWSLLQSFGILSIWWTMSECCLYIYIVLLNMFSQWFLAIFNTQIQSENDCQVTWMLQCYSFMINDEDFMTSDLLAYCMRTEAVICGPQLSVMIAYSSNCLISLGWLTSTAEGARQYNKCANLLFTYSPERVPCMFRALFTHNTEVPCMEFSARKRCIFKQEET